MSASGTSHISPAKLPANGPGKPATSTKCRPLSDLDPNDLFIHTIYQFVDRPDSFHWGLYLHENIQGGWKYHITRMDPGWIADHAPSTSALSTRALIGLVRVAKIPASQKERVQEIIAEDTQLNQVPGMTCRVFVGRACERLKSAGLMTFNTWNDVKQEVRQFVSTNIVGADHNDQPRPVVDSKACGF